jgi:hypothetical protein
MTNWVAEFAGYRVNITEQRIDRWLDQFRPDDRGLAARLLDSLDFVGNDKIAAAYRSSLAMLHGWDRDPANRVGTWRFVPFSVSAGESGDSMLHRFRGANQLGSTSFHELFIHIRDLLEENLQPNDHVVFVDDIAASGDQAVKAWESPLSELLPNRPTTYLVLAVATQRAIDRILGETGFDHVLADTILTDDDGVFKSRFFDTEERELIVRYGKRASPSTPRGYKDLGHLVVLAHKCPNGTLPILHASREGRWQGLFPRSG